MNVRTTLPSAARCDDIGDGKLSSTARFSGANLNRLESVRATIAPEQDLSMMRGQALLLANFQEELEKPSPDLLLAGTYLGLVSKIPLNPDRVKQVTNGLCVPCSNEQASEIARVAEDQRLVPQK